MKITEKVLSLPPYISTSWKNIFSLQVESRPYGHILLIELATGSKVEIPNLDPKVIENIFAMHSQVVEQEGQKGGLQTFTIPFALPIEGLSSVMQHNPEQSEMPPLPQEVLERFKMLRSALPEDLSSFPKAEPHCNCPYCQVVRAVQSDEESASTPEEVVTDKDLTFRAPWDIKQESDKIYTVTSLEGSEHYNVFLGEPFGCTCGSKNCEHIAAVLRS